MAAVPRFSKDPAAVLEYGWDLTRWLAPGESVTSCTWAITGPDDDPVDTALAVDVDFPGFSSGQYVASPLVAVALKIGTLGASYYVDGTWATDQGRTDSRRMAIKITDR